MKNQLIIIVVLLLISYTATAQAKRVFTNDQKAKHEQKIRTKFGKDWRFSYNEGSNSLRRMRGSYKLNGAITSESEASKAAKGAFETIGGLIAIPFSDFKVKTSRYDGYLNRYKVVLQQYYNGIEVEGGQLFFSMYKNGELYNITNSTFPAIEVNTTPVISTDAALQTISRNKYDFINKQKPEIQLTIIPGGHLKTNSQDRLCYKIKYDERTFFVDAGQGEILLDYSNYIRERMDYSSEMPEINDRNIPDITTKADLFATNAKDAANYTYTGNIKGEVFPLANPNGIVENRNLEGTYIWFDYDPLNPLTTEHDIITDANGNFSSTIAGTYSSVRAKLESDRIEVLNDQGNPLESFYRFPPGGYTYAYNFQDAPSPGHEANIYYNLTEQLKWFDTKFPGHNQLPKFRAISNHDYNDPAGSVTNGDCTETWVRYSADGAKSSHVIRHECSHYFVYYQNGNWLCNRLSSDNYECMNEAIPQYLSAAARNNSNLLNLIDLSEIIPVEDKNIPLATLNELDHAHYVNRNAVASAWWAIRNGIGETKFNDLLYKALDNINNSSIENVTPRDFYNQLLTEDDIIDNNPFNLTPDFSVIDAAYVARGMNYYPKIETTDIGISQKGQFDQSEDIYATFSRCPTNENIRIYIVNHKESWENGDPLADVSGEYKTLNTGQTGGGANYNILVWSGKNRTLTGNFDIIFDVDNNGKYDFDFDGRIDGKNTFKIVSPAISINNVQFDKTSFVPNEVVTATITLNNSITGADVSFTCNSQTYTCTGTAPGIYTKTFNAPSIAGNYDLTVLSSKTGYIDATPFQTAVNVANITSLYAGNTNPPVGNTETNFQLSVYFRDIQAPQYVRVIGTGWSKEMVGSGTYSTGAQFSANTAFPSAGNYSYYFEAKTSDGTILRYPESENMPALNVIQSASGWEVAVDPLNTSYLPATITKGTTLTVNNTIKNSGIYDYTNIDGVVEIRYMNGDLINAVRFSTGPITSQSSKILTPVTLTVPNDAQIGSYTITSVIYPQLDQEKSNNAISYPCYIGENLGIEQFRNTAGQETINKVSPNSISVNGLIFTLTDVNTTTGYATVSDPQGVLNNINLNQIKVYGSQNSLIQNDTVYTDETTGYATLTGYYAITDGAKYDKTELNASPGTTVYTYATAPSGYLFSDSNYELFSTSTSTIKNWFGAVSKENTWNRIKISFNIPADAPTGKTTLYFLTKYSSPPGASDITRITFYITNPVPTITSLNKSVVSAQDEITIAGSDLGTSGTVKFGELVATTSNWTNNSISCKVPQGVSNGIVTVINGNGISNGLAYNVISSTGDPIVLTPVPDQLMNQNSSLVAASLSNVFSDPNGGQLAFTASASSPDITPSVSNGILTIFSNSTATGTYQIVVSAKDPDNVTAQDIFQLTIINPAPLIEVSPAALTSFGNIQTGLSSASQSFTVSGSNLTADISITAPSGFQISASGSAGYGSVLILPHSGGTVATTTIYTRFSPFSAGSFSGSITVSSSGTFTQIATVSGVGFFPPTINASPSTLSFNNVIKDATSSPLSYNVSGSCLTDDLTITAPAGFKLSQSKDDEFRNTITLTQNGGAIPNTTIYLVFSPTAEVMYSGNMLNSSSGAATKSVALSGTGVTCKPAAPIVGTITHPTCTLTTGSVILTGLPTPETWTLTRIPGGETIRGTGPGTKISGLASGTYSYTVTNATGCTSASSANITINVPPAIPGAPTVESITHPTCSLATGSVVLNGLPSTGTWTLIRTPGDVTTTGTGTSTSIAGLTTGTYSYTVTNAAGCTSGASITISINTQPATPAAPTIGTITQPKCALATGSLVLNGLPATGTWTLIRTPGGAATTGTGKSTTITGLSAGTYTFAVTNIAGCASSGSAGVTISEQPVTPAAPIIETITQPTCSLASGSVVLNGLPAAGPWSLTRTPGGTTTTGTGTSATITGLSAGTCTYSVTNAAGCTSPGSASITINVQPATPAAPVLGIITQPTCSITTGSVLLNGLPANGSWILTGTPGGTIATGTGTSKTLTGLTAGTYTYAVTNSAGCTSVASAILAINNPPQIPVIPNQSVSIQSGEGFIVNPAGVVAGTTFSWSTPVYTGGVTGGNAQLIPQSTITGNLTIAAGTGTATYIVTPVSGGCAGSAFNVVVTVTSSCIPVNVVDQPADHAMCGMAGNTVLSVGVGGTAPFAFQWQYHDGDIWKNVADGTPSGAVYSNTTSANLSISGISVTGSLQYRCSVTNCSGTNTTTSNTATILLKTIPTAPTIGTITQPTCSLASGSVVLNGLPPSGSWTLVQIPGGATTTGSGTSMILSGLASGTYSYQVTNAEGCTSSTSANFTINDQPVTPVIPDLAVSILTGETFVVNPPEALPGTTFTWLTPAVTGGVTGGNAKSIPQSNISGSLSLPSGTGTATYSITPVTGTCTGAAFNLTVTVTSSCVPVTIDTHPADKMMCETTGNATFSVTAKGTAPFTYQWQYHNGGTWANVVDGIPAGASYASANTASIVISGISNTGNLQYRCIVTNCSGADQAISNTASLLVNALPGAPKIELVTQPATMNGTGSVALSGLPDSGNWILTTYPGGIVHAGTGTGINLTALTAGTYNFKITNESGCTSVSSANVVIHPPNGVPIANAGPEQSVNEGLLVMLDGSLSSDPDGNPLTYRWTSPAGIILSSVTEPKPTFMAPNVGANTNYSFSLVVNDGFADSPANQTLVTVLNLDKAPYVKDSIKNISVDKGMTDQVIDLKTIFADDDITDVLVYSVTSNLNENVVIAKITSTTLTLTFSKINAGKSELIITASSNGKSVQSKFSVEVKLPTAIDPVSYTREISIYPNPTKGIVHIKFSDYPPAGTKIVVYDLSGKTISESFATAKEEHLMLTGNPSGFYLIKINKKIPVTFKIVLE